MHGLVALKKLVANAVVSRNAVRVAARPNRCVEGNVRPKWTTVMLFKGYLLYSPDYKAK
jgi:hypothetical protein